MNVYILVSTADEVDGQFTIPGRGTFNVINTERSSSANQNRSNRSRNERVSSPDQETEPESETESEDVAPDAGDESETEININVRYLDESVKNCSFRPSQSLGHFKRKLIMIKSIF